MHMTLDVRVENNTEEMEQEQEVITEEQRMFNRQLDLEMTMHGMGLTRYRNTVAGAKQDREESRTHYGKVLLRQAIEPLVKALTAFVKYYNPKGGRRHIAQKYLATLDLEVVALVTAKMCLDQISIQATLQQAARRIASGLEDEARFSAFAKSCPELWGKLNKNVTQHATHRRRVLLHVQQTRMAWEEWPKDDKLFIGMKCIELFCAYTGLATTTLLEKGKRDTPQYLVATPKTLEWIKNDLAHDELLHPVYMPTLIPPLDWTSPYDGGYYGGIVRPLTLVKTHDKEYLEELEGLVEEQKDVYSAINHLQRVPWKINTKVLEVAREAWEQGMSIAKLPPRLSLPIPERPDGIPRDVPLDELPEEQRIVIKSWKRAVVQTHKANARFSTKVIQTEKILSIATYFKDEKAIWFPHQFDFRGRVYAVPMFLQPQGSDIAKGLLTFANGKPIEDQEAADWLSIHGANLWGYDKVPMLDRVLWAYLHVEDIRASVAHPLDELWWSKADKPWQFLAWCQEFVGWLDQGWGYVSSLPIAMDGSCNGLQHYSAALRDEVGGRAVNLLPGTKPNDIYQDVADLTILKLQHALENEEDETKKELAAKWLAYGINRKTTKRPVMVVPYSGTLDACKKYVREHVEERNEEGDVHPFGEHLFRAGSYLATHIWASIGETVIKAKEAMGWLQKAARLLSEPNIPITWVTPDNFVIKQAYFEDKARRVETRLGDKVVKLWVCEQLNVLDKRRQAEGIAPNFVHGLDASALRMTTNNAVKRGISQFAMIHDSYGTVAADTADLARILRHSFVNLYKRNDVFAQFEEWTSPILVGKRLPPRPRKGTLNLDEIKASTFFFA